MIWYLAAIVAAGALLAATAWYILRIMLMTYVGAEKEDGALAVLKKLLAAGFDVISDPLGEFTEDPAQLPLIQHQYMQHIQQLGDLRQEFPNRTVSIAIKPSRVYSGTDLFEFTAALKPLVYCARSRGVFVWLDAEKRSSLDMLKKAVLRLDEEKFYNIGIAVQAMHSFSANTARELSAAMIPIRVVKGAYADGDITLTERLDENFIIICRTVATHWPASAKPHLALGTHDTELIGRVRKACPRALLEHQFLYGVRTTFQDWCLRHGESTVVYMPWGSFADARGYFIRRLKEGVRFKTLWLFMRNILEARRFRDKYIK